MPLFAALILSLTLHAALILGPAWLAAQPRPVLQPRIEARLLAPDETLVAAESVSTTAASPVLAPEKPLPPRPLQGKSLRRAEAALTRHLFYPPEAVARGQEGEVILLLTLTDSGQLTQVEVARSSGHALLDQAALDAAGRIGVLPGNKRQLLFPVRFRLQ